MVELGGHTVGAIQATKLESAILAFVDSGIYVNC